MLAPYNRILLLLDGVLASLFRQLIMECFEATNNGQWVAYQNGVQIAINLPTTITMSDVADYWKRH